MCEGLSASAEKPRLVHYISFAFRRQAETRRFFVFLLFFATFPSRQNVHRALDALLHHGARHGVRLLDIAVVVIVVCAAPARADELRKAVFALLAREEAAPRKLGADLFIERAFKDAAHLPLIIPRELVAGVDVAVRDDGEVLVPRAAGGNALRKARPAFKVDVEVEEVEALPLSSRSKYASQRFSYSFSMRGRCSSLICNSVMSVTTGSIEMESNP